MKLDNYHKSIKILTLSVGCVKGADMVFLHDVHGAFCRCRTCLVAAIFVGENEERRKHYEQETSLDH